MQLNYKKFGEGFPIIVLHGLLGSLDNWQTIAKKLAEPSTNPAEQNFSTYILDQRNHGRSPHTEDINYDLLAQDLLEFLQQQNISKVHLIGHSMGGKTVMQFALQHPEMVHKLIVVDITPDQYSDHHSIVFNALFAASTASREEAQETLRQKLEDETTVQFLLKSLTRTEEGEKGNYKWRFNLQALHHHYPEIADAITATGTFHGQTLFIKGEKSNYINSSNYHTIASLFPNNELEEIKDAGHWVHAEQPHLFTEIALKFLRNG